MRGLGKRFVYVLRGGGLGDHYYAGITSDPERRLEWHNHGPCGLRGRLLTITHNTCNV